MAARTLALLVALQHVRVHPVICQSHVAMLCTVVCSLRHQAVMSAPNAPEGGRDPRGPKEPRSRYRADGTRRRSKGELEKRAPWAAWWKERQQKEREHHAQRDAAQSSGESRTAPQNEAVESSRSDPYPNARASSSKPAPEPSSEWHYYDDLMTTRMMAGMESLAILGKTIGPLIGMIKGGTIAGISTAIVVLTTVPTMTWTTTGGTMSVLVPMPLMNHSMQKRPPAHLRLVLSRHRQESDDAPGFEAMQREPELAPELQQLAHAQVPVLAQAGSASMCEGDWNGRASPPTSTAFYTYLASASWTGGPLVTWSSGAGDTWSSPLKREKQAMYSSWEWRP